jgi:hypothetical protein
MGTSLPRSGSAATSATTTCSPGACGRAGLVLTDGRGFLLFGRVTGPVALKDRGDEEDVQTIYCGIRGPGGSGGLVFGGPPPRGATYLRLTRRGRLLTMQYSVDGRDWSGKGQTAGWNYLPRRVKVGVAMEATADGTFVAEFDQFALTPLSVGTTP